MSEYDLFYRDCRNRIFSYLVRMTGDYGLAADILQETFARHLERYRGENRSLFLLYRIARNLFLDEMRRRKRRPAADEDGEEVDADQERRLMIRSEYRRVLAAMASLAEDERDILVLAAGGDLSYREIAALSEISEANVKVKVHRARLKLKKALQEGEP